MPLFCFGIALGLRRQRSRVSAETSRKRSLDLPIFGLLASVALLAVFWPVQYREVFINGGAAILFGLIVLLCTYRSPWAEKVLGNRAMDRLGKASYITYIIQAPLWHYFLAFCNLLTRRTLSDSTATMAQFLIFGVVLVGVSLCLDLFVDEPVRNWFNRRRKPFANVVIRPVPQSGVLMDGTSGS
jgi:peptidoglycan/LPS O-acetylase OafA/YrhL